MILGGNFLSSSNVTKETFSLNWHQAPVNVSLSHPYVAISMISKEGNISTIDIFGKIKENVCEH